jgi:APA family basic amino acid/polyamine antiporter
VLATLRTVECADLMPASVALARRLTLFDATMIVMGGIVGAGIFMNPAVVAQEVASSAAALGAWVLGGAFALVGAFIYAELAARRPEVGGQYAYLREAFHPLAAFLYAWTLLLVSQSGGMAAVAMTFARYFLTLTGWAPPVSLVAVGALAALTMVNCLGVRAGSNLQSAFMVLKIGAVAMLVAFGFGTTPLAPAGAPHEGATSPGAFGAALVPVLFAYGGWQTAGFMSGELKNPQRDMPRGLLIGVVGVVALYLLVNVVCLRVLGLGGLAATATPASDVMRAAVGETGATIIAAGIAISTLGFLSQNLLTGPRVYFAMARDGVFFRGVAAVSARTGAPYVAIILQGAVASLLALSGSYERILGFVVAIDWVFFGLTALALVVLRKRDDTVGVSSAFLAPLHPWTTLAFTAGAWVVVVTTVVRFPTNALAGLGLLVIGVPVYYIWRRKQDA